MDEILDRAGYDMLKQHHKEHHADLAAKDREIFKLRSTLNTIATARWEPGCNWRGAAEWLQEQAREAIKEAK